MKELSPAKKGAQCWEQVHESETFPGKSLSYRNSESAHNDAKRPVKKK